MRGLQFAVGEGREPGGEAGLANIGVVRACRCGLRFGTFRLVNAGHDKICAPGRYVKVVDGEGLVAVLAGGFTPEANERRPETLIDVMLKEAKMIGEDHTGFSHDLLNGIGFKTKQEVASSCEVCDNANL
jgi:hypothetical protein